MKKLTIPESLKPGDTIGIICPSAGISQLASHRLDQARKNIEGMGFKLKIGNHVIIRDNSYVSGSVEERLSDLHDMFSDPLVAMIITGIGGNHSNHLLKYIDYDLIRNNPKIVIGYSDITVLHYALNTQANLATYYGPCAATQFGEFPNVLPYTKKWFEFACVDGSHNLPKNIEPSESWTVEFLDWFKKIDQTRPRILTRNFGFNWLNNGRAEGEALPGCILSMNRLAGTPYWIDPKGKILFLDVLSSPGELDEAMVDSFLTDLKNMGVFDEIVGLVIGRPYGYSEQSKNRLYGQIMDLTQKKYPIVTEFDIGHTDPMVTIRYGQKISLDSVKKQIKFLD